MNESPRQALYLEDLAPGQQYSSPSLTLDEAAIIDYARQFDPQPFHLDDEAARDSLFGGLAASGWHTASLTMRLFVDSEFQPAGGLIGASIENLRWPQPVRPGDTLSLTIEVLETRAMRSRPNRGMIKVRVDTRNQHAELVQGFDVNMVVQRRA